MSYVVNTSTDTFTRGQDHPGSVPVSGVCEATVPAQEGSFTQSEALLGSHAAQGAGHCRKGGRHQHHRSARSQATLDQFCLRCADSSVGALASRVFRTWMSVGWLGV